MTDEWSELEKKAKMALAADDYAIQVLQAVSPDTILRLIRIARAARDLLSAPVTNGRIEGSAIAALARALSGASREVRG